MFLGTALALSRVNIDLCYLKNKQYEADFNIQYSIYDHNIMDENMELNMNKNLEIFMNDNKVLDDN